MKRSILILLAFCFFPLASNATDVSGPVSGTWTLSGSPYNVIGQINIPSGQELVIEPGVQVIFQGWYKFLIYGRLQAIGTISDSISFTAPDTTHGWHGLRFYDINSEPDSSRLVYCKITYGKSSSENSAGDDKNGGAIFCSNSGKLRIEHCLIAHNRTGDVVGASGYNGSGGGYWGDPGGPGENAKSGDGGAIYLLNSSLLIIHNCFNFNKTGGAAGGTGGEGGDAVGWLGATGGAGGSGGEGQSGRGGAIFMRDSNPIIDWNILRQNVSGTAIGGVGGQGGNANAYGGGGAGYGGNGGIGGNGIGGQGGAIGSSTGLSCISNNLFYENQTGNATGGMGGQGGNCNSGGIAYGGNGGDGGHGYGGDGAGLGFDGDGSFLNINTIAENRCGQGNGGSGGLAGSGFGPVWLPGDPGNLGEGFHGEYAIHCSGTTWPSIVNSIIWDNDLPVIGGSPQITYSCIEGGYPGIGNFNSDPLFVGTSLGDYFLSQMAAGQTQQSPCVDAGDPSSAMFEGTTRVDGIQDTDIVDMGYHYPNFIAQPVLIVSPLVLEFDANPGGSNPAPQTFVVSNGQTGSFNYEVLEDIDWLSVEPLGGSVPPSAVVTVFVDIAGLIAGQYDGDIVVMAGETPGSPDTVHVSLQLGSSILVLSMDSLTFFAAPAPGGSNPPNQTFLISNEGLGIFYFNISESAVWLSVSPQTGGPVPPTTEAVVSVSIAGLSYGLYEVDIEVVAPGAIGSPQVVHVRLFINQLSGSLSGTLPRLDYQVVNNLYVNPGYPLLIEAGSVLSFMGPYSFGIYGSLSALGIETDTIKFIRGFENIPWSGLYFSSPDGENLLEYCYVSGSDNSGVRIIGQTHVTFNHCWIRGNSDSSWGNSKGGGIRSEGSYPVFNFCTISENAVLLPPDDIGFGGGIYVSYSGVFNQCIVANNVNESPYGAGGGIYCWTGTNVIFDRCVISNNTAVGIDAGGGGAYVDDGCAFLNCDFSSNSVSGTNFSWGAGLGATGNETSVLNCIFYGNDGDAVFSTNAGALSVGYCSFYANLDSAFSGVVAPGSGQLATTNINGDSCDIYHNIFLDPLFVNPDSGDFHLTAESPCIDAGDPESPLDPDSTIADMGVFYFPHVVGIAEPLERYIPETFFLQGNHPNPFNPATTITFGVPVASWVKVEVFDIAGRLVGSGPQGGSLRSQARPLREGWYEAGVHEVTFDGSDLPSGIYLVRFQAGDFSAVEKMVLLK